LLHGWLGGGCTRGAVKRAAVDALREGRPQLVSVAPEDLLEERGVAAGEEVDGTRFARNGCPSRGTVDIFIEPCLPMPELAVLGTSPVAQALSQLAPQFHWAVVTQAPEAASNHRQSFIVIATQGQDDLKALEEALAARPDYIAFVGSARKFESLAETLVAKGAEPEAVSAVHAPAGLDLGAVTPEEIALSILAQLVQVRRQSLGASHA
jgi:xanthine dehydrogenase accessory factor